MSDETDILMITYNRAEYTRMALPKLIDSADEFTRIWLWHNGDDEETLSVVEEHAKDPRVYRFHHSRENVRLGPPTAWLFDESRGAYLSKVDDDCLVPEGWLKRLRACHTANPHLGVLGCWRFLDCDYDEHLVNRKLRELEGGHRLMSHPWVEGSGFLMKRACREEIGSLGKGESFPNYCLRIALSGRENGWYFPFLWQEHLDDPRAPNSPIATDEDFRRHIPLSATNFGASTIEEWDAQLRRSARTILKGSSNPHSYVGWRSIPGRARKRIERKLRDWRSAARSGKRGNA